MDVDRPPTPVAGAASSGTVSSGTVSSGAVSSGVMSSGATSSPSLPAEGPEPHHVLVAVDLAASVDAAAQARRVVRDLLERGDRTDLVDTACLLTSELVANAVVHAGAPVELVVDLDRGRLAVEVIDSADGAPSPVVAGPFDTGGRGLAMVARLSDAWGVTRVVPGKSVWFALSG